MRARLIVLAVTLAAIAPALVHVLPTPIHGY